MTWASRQSRPLRGGQDLELPIGHTFSTYWAETFKAQMLP